MFAIDVKSVSKTYRLYRKPSDRLKEIIFKKPLHTPFDSLSDVSFSVPFGESLGIIGDNGAGKSTILKIIAGTLSPSSGVVKAGGRVAALLELGAGFHFEFTGRENIWMNASLMGLKGNEIKAREHSIIDLSELGEFIDRPIRTYSSGMVVRLAFSIATSVDPDILIIDEALSVGDQYFQKKCIDRMIDFKNSNKTILFCSHAMFTVNQLCDRAIWFDRGKIREVGTTTHITANYENYTRGKSDRREKSETNDSKPEEKNGNQKDRQSNSTPNDQKKGTGEHHIPVMVSSISLNGSTESIELQQGDDLCVEIEYESFGDTPFFIAAGIRRNDDLVCHAANMAKEVKEPLSGKGCGKVTLLYKKLPFLHGWFSLVVFMMDDSGLHCFYKKESALFSVLPQDQWENEIGLLKLDHEWYVG